MNLQNGFNNEHSMDLTTTLKCETSGNKQTLQGLTGLRNLGNMCYMNAALQALSNCPPFREYFLSYLIVDESSNDLATFGLQSRNSIAASFKDLLTQIWANDKIASSITPFCILARFREKCPQFRAFVQQDSQEFTRCFLDILHQELRRPIKKWEEDFINNCKNWMKELPSSSSCANSSPTANKSLESGDFVSKIESDEVSPSAIMEDDNEEHFETADSGLSSDTDSTKGSDGQSNHIKKNMAEKIVGYRSVVTDVFDGELVSSVKCQTCQHISYTNENFQDISLSIPTIEQLEYLNESSLNLPSSSTENSTSENVSTETNVAETDSNSLIQSSYGYFYWFLTLAARWMNPWYSWFTNFYRYIFSNTITLEHCLRAFFSMDFLHGEDMYSCEKCSKLRNGVKQCELTRLPEILCIHLKRFRHDNMYNTKMNTRVSFPLIDLDLRPFIKNSVLEKDEKMITKYDLVAIVSHRGSSVDFGHYTAYCRNEFDKNWYEFDDAIITRVNALEVMSREAYMLFYQKKTSDRIEETRLHCQTLMQNSLKEQLINVDLSRFCISIEWFHKFSTFTEPGPINNCNFLCPHGQKAPSNENTCEPLYILVVEDVWSYLHRRMSGGPTCLDNMPECAKCRRVQDRMLKRKAFERKTFEELEASNFNINNFPPNAISAHWLEKWRAFVQQTASEPPPPINNESIVKKVKDGTIKLRAGVRIAKINRQTWLFLHRIYGGGPELLAFPFRQPTSEQIDNHFARIETSRLEHYKEKNEIEELTITNDINDDIAEEEHKEDDSKMEIDNNSEFREEEQCPTPINNLADKTDNSGTSL